MEWLIVGVCMFFICTGAVALFHKGHDRIEVIGAMKIGALSILSVVLWPLTFILTVTFFFSCMAKKREGGYGYKRF